MAGKMKDFKREVLFSIFRCLRLRLVFLPFLLAQDPDGPPDP